MAQLEIRLQPHGPVYRPGEMLQGHLLLTSESAVNANGIDVELVGTCATRAWAPRGGSATDRSSTDWSIDRSTANEGHNGSGSQGPSGSGSPSGPHNNTQRADRELVMESIEFCLVQFQPQESGPFATGQHQIEFSLQVPELCSSRTLCPEWRGLPLPSSVEDVHPDGVISYQLRAKVRTSGIFSCNVRAKRQINIRSAASCSPDAAMLARRRFVQQKLSVHLYDSAVERWSDWALRMLGQPTASSSLPFRAKLVHSAAGLPAADVPLSQVAQLKIYKLENDKKDAEVELDALEVTLIYTVACRAQGSTTVNTKEVPLLRRAEHDALHFTPDEHDLSCCDLTELLKNARLGNFVSQVTPNLTVRAALRVDVGIVPTVGNPVKAVYARLESDVNIYWGVEPPREVPQSEWAGPQEPLEPAEPSPPPYSAL